jgi:hypothetical protein
LSVSCLSLSIVLFFVFVGCVKDLLLLERATKVQHHLDPLEKAKKVGRLDPLERAKRGGGHLGRLEKARRGVRLVLQALLARGAKVHLVLLARAAPRDLQPPPVLQEAREDLQVRPDLQVVGKARENQALQSL